jgi:hypothetical protein
MFQPCYLAPSYTVKVTDAINPIIEQNRKAVKPCPPIYITYEKKGIPRANMKLQI